MTETFLGYLLAVVALVLFTSGILVTKVASSRINLGLGFLIAASTNVVFASLAFAVQLWLHPEGVAWSWPGFFLFAVAGAFSTYLGRWFFYESVVRFGPSRASVFQVSSPLFTALIAWLLLGEYLTTFMGYGLLVTIAGLMLVSYKPGFFARGAAAVDSTTPLLTRKERLLRSVFFLGMGSSLAYAVGNVMRGAAIRAWNEPVLGALLGAVVGLALYLGFSSGKREMLAGLRSASRSGLWLYGLMGVTTIAAQMCAIAAMRYIPLSIATLITLCTPVLVFPLSRLLFKDSEEVSLITIVGCALTLFGIFIIVLR